MLKLLDNPWIVGIGTGLISGIIVFFLSKFIMDKKGRVDYLKQVEIANLNVINSMKPYIADKGLPELTVFEALIKSMARLLNVDEKDMFTVDICCEELIREIISDVYVSNEKKKEYTEQLANYKRNLKQKDVKVEKLLKEENENLPNLVYSNYNYKLRFQMSIFISVLYALLIFMTVLLFFQNNFRETLIYDSEFILLIPLFITVILVMAIYLLFILQIRRNKKE